MCEAAGATQLGCTARRLLQHLFFESYLRQLRRERPISNVLCQLSQTNAADGAKRFC
jgi:hypothetical protein